MTVRAALYSRVSTSAQDPEMQVAELRDAAARRDWEVVCEVVEDGVSGAAGRRPGLESILADSAAGKIDVVAVWRLDRFGRSLSHPLHGGPPS